MTLLDQPLDNSTEEYLKLKMQLESYSLFVFKSTNPEDIQNAIENLILLYKWRELNSAGASSAELLAVSSRVRYLTPMSYLLAQTFDIWNRVKVDDTYAPITLQEYIYHFKLCPQCACRAHLFSSVLSGKSVGFITDSMFYGFMSSIGIYKLDSSFFDKLSEAWDSNSIFKTQWSLGESVNWINSPKVLFEGDSLI